MKIVPIEFSAPEAARKSPCQASAHRQIQGRRARSIQFSMNRFPLFGATFVLLGLIAFATRAQTQNSMTTTNYVQTTKIVGMKVKDANGEAIGTVKDVVLDRETGCMAYTVISTGDPGTRLTGTTKTVAVPWAVYNTVSDPGVLTLTVDRERVYAAPAFEYSRINEYSTSNYINDVYSYYGVQPNGGKVGANAESSSAVSGQASTSAQTIPTASPIATVSPSPSLTPTPTPTASPSASLSPTAKAKAPWAEAATKGASATPSPSATERRKTSEESKEETSSSSDKARGHREETASSPNSETSPHKTRRTSEDFEADESRGTKSSKRTPAEASPTP
jgi:sporulation protein YlmC with PRC-barrel domain